ncbi:MAG: HDOD domain-containing protein, partial [Melioribacteraceae bacterium]|nr:HDOD domain-containing protein [Melioribacteraceae bacterium]
PNSAVYHGIWNHSNRVAFTAKQLAASANLSILDNEDSYLGGLLHDIGKIILLDKIDGIKIGSDLKFDEYESKFNNVTHADVGAYLLGIWGLPDSIVECIAYHNSIENITFENISPSTIVTLANRIANNSEIEAIDIDKNNIKELFEKFGKISI